MESPTAESGARGARRLAPGDLMSLEQYARSRVEFRARVIEHKRARTIGVGPHTTWCFEDRLTVQYQVREMLRAERICLSCEVKVTAICLRLAGKRALQVLLSPIALEVYDASP